MEKVILEEINSMKYLLGYKRGIVISEQQTTVSGNDLENIPDETPAANTGTEIPAANTGTETPVTPAATTGPIKMGVKNPRVQYLQELLNYKFQSGLDPDGKYGPKTAAAILKNIEAIKQTPKVETPKVETPVTPVTASSNAPDEDNSPNPNIPTQ
jgi:peptidoglycan hydrolase-like protein with peptidoglycan-binding domain